jgi:hypothetical protein
LPHTKKDERRRVLAAKQRCLHSFIAHRNLQSALLKCRREREKESLWERIALGWNENPTNIILNLLDQRRADPSALEGDRPAYLQMNKCRWVRIRIILRRTYLVLLPRGISSPAFVLP